MRLIRYNLTHSAPRGRQLLAAAGDTFIVVVGQPLVAVVLNMMLVCTMPLCGNLTCSVVKCHVGAQHPHLTFSIPK